jgi:hypothetical protein
MDEIKSDGKADKADEFEVLREVINLTDQLPYEAAQRVFTYAVQRLNSKGGLFNKEWLQEKMSERQFVTGLGTGKVLG